MRVKAADREQASVGTVSNKGHRVAVIETHTIIITRWRHEQRVLTLVTPSVGRRHDSGMSQH